MAFFKDNGFSLSNGLKMSVFLNYYFDHSFHFPEIKMADLDFYAGGVLSYSEVLDVSFPNVWCPSNHGDFTAAFRGSKRQVLLGASHLSFRFPAMRVAALDALSLLEAEDVGLVGGVAYVSSTQATEEDLVLYEVDSEGNLLRDYSEDCLAVVSPSGAPPPKTMCAAAHREYLRDAELNVDLLCLSPEVFSSYPRHRAHLRSSSRVLPQEDAAQEDEVFAQEEEELGDEAFVRALLAVLGTGVEARGEESDVESGEEAPLDASNSSDSFGSDSDTDEDEPPRQRRRLE